MKTQHFTLSLPEPCSEAWEQMTPCGSGKFCDSCQKTVIDFTDYSEAQIAAFFADKAGESVCGRFYASQIENEVFSYTAPAKRPARTLAMAASVAALVVVSFATEAQVKGFDPGITIVDSSRAQLSAEDTTNLLVVEGTVKDDKDEPLLSVSIQLLEDNRVIAGTVTDLDGNYRIVIPQGINMVKSGTLTIKCCFLGCTTEELTIPLHQQTISFQVNFSLKSPSRNSKDSPFIGLIIRRLDIPLIDLEAPGSKTTITAPQLEKMPR